MRILRSLYTWAIAAGIAASIGVWIGVQAQTGLIPTSMTGYEAVVAQQTGPGSQSIYLLSGMLRNTTGGITSAATTGTQAWPTTTVGGVAAPPAQYQRIVYTGAVGTMTQNLQANPFDGQTVELVNGQASTWTALTVAVTDGSTTVNFGAALALTAGGSAEFYFLKSSNSWYRIR